MSRDQLGTDDKEPWKASGNTQKFVTRNEFQNLYMTTVKIGDDVTDLRIDVKAMRTHIEDTETVVKQALAKKEHERTKWFALITLIVSVISIGTGVLLKLALP